MTRRKAETYIEKRDALLLDCLRLTEDIYSGVGEPESLPALLDRRMEMLRELRLLDEAAGEARSACPKEALAQSDAGLRLIQNLDAKIEAALRDAQSKLLSAMKRNAAERRFTGYAAADVETGRRLDQKK
jgi:hypothetical protein